jgi:hypothetical protein
MLLRSAATIDAEETKNARGPDCPAAAAGPGRLHLLQQQQQSIAARKRHNHCRAARFNHHSLTPTYRSQGMPAGQRQTLCGSHRWARRWRQPFDSRSPSEQRPPLANRSTHMRSATAQPLWLLRRRLSRESSAIRQWLRRIEPTISRRLEGRARAIKQYSPHGNSR